MKKGTIAQQIADDEAKVDEEQEAKADLYRTYEYEQELQDKHFFYKEYDNRFKKANKILECLRENARESFAEISRKTGIPISTIFDVFNATIKKDFKFVTRRK